MKNPEKKTKILVTGGLGYIGSHTVVELIKAGFEVVVVDDLSNSREEVLDRITLITGIKPIFYQTDLCREHELWHLLKCEKNIQAVIHFAASKAVGESVKKPLKYYRNNLMGMINLIEGMRNTGVRKLVFSSSCTVYGQPDRLPVNEHNAFLPAQSPYGNTKQICEEILKDCTVSDPHFQVISLRYFNPAGAHPSGLIGEYPLGKPSNLVPVITQSAIGLSGPVKVFGSDYNTTDGTAIRDYIHVVDLASAHLSAMELLLQTHSEKPYRVYNIGTGVGVSVLEIIKAFEQSNGLKLDYELVDRRAGDIEEIYADATLVNEQMNWKPQCSLNDIMKDAWKWQKSL